MAVLSTISNRFKYMRDTKQIDMSADSFIGILMNTTFAFDLDTHSTLSDVTANQIATGNGYTQDNKSVVVSSVTEDDVNDRSQTIWADVIWTTSGGSISATGAMIIYDNTTTEKTVVGCIDFGEDFTAVDGVSIKISNIIFNSN